jgi:hypothetical protein
MSAHAMQFFADNWPRAVRLRNETKELLGFDAILPVSALIRWWFAVPGIYGPMPANYAASVLVSFVTLIYAGERTRGVRALQGNHCPQTNCPEGSHRLQLDVDLPAI